MIKHPIILSCINIRWASKQYLCHARGSLSSTRPKHSIVNRWITPSKKVQTNISYRLFYHLAAASIGFRRALLRGQEEHSNGEVIRVTNLNMLLFKFFAQQLARDLRKNTRAIIRLCIGILCPTMTETS